MGYENTRGEDMDRIVARMRQARRDEAQQAINQHVREQLDAVALRPRFPHFVSRPPAHPGPAIFGPYTRPSRSAVALRKLRHDFDNWREWFYNLEPVYRVRCAWYVLIGRSPF